MADSGAKSVSELLSAFFDRDMAAAGAAYSGFGRAWKSIAGTRLGEHSRPADIRHGILIVEAEHQGWMQLLQLQQDRILEEIARRFPELEIGGIAFRLSHGDFSRPVEPVAPERAEREAPIPAAPQPPPGREKAAEAAAEAKSGLPPEILAMFSRIRKNAKQ